MANFMLEYPQQVQGLLLLMPPALPFLVLESEVFLWLSLEQLSFPVSSPFSAELIRMSYNQLWEGRSAMILPDCGATTHHSDVVSSAQ